MRVIKRLPAPKAQEVADPALIRPVKDSVSAAEWAARMDLAAAYRAVALYGWDDLVFTHISARVPGSDHHFLINPYGMFFEEITASSLVKVNLASGRECYGEVAATSKQRDLAIIRLDCTGLTPLPVSRQKLVEGGEVFAIGTPFSEKLQFSVTRGVVSGIRKIDDSITSRATSACIREAAVVRCWTRRATPSG